LIDQLSIKLFRLIDYNVFFSCNPTKTLRQIVEVVFVMSNASWDTVD